MLYNKYRPKSFDQILHHTKTVTQLRNGLERGDLPQALFLAGLSGLGKTSIARLVAMSIHCENRNGVDPCGECASCTDITSGSYQLGTMVLDGGQLNVDEMRSLEKYVNTSSLTSDKKVVIIEEFQELNNNPKAQNILLPLLENAVDGIYFIILAMDDSKVSKAIKNRCSLHHLQPIPLETIAGHLVEVATSEGHDIGQDETKATVLVDIAEKSGGSLRQAITWLEDVLQTNAWDSDSLFELTGIAGSKLATETTRKLLNKDPDVFSMKLTKDLIESVVNVLSTSLLIKLKATVPVWKRDYAIKRGVDQDEAIRILEILLGGMNAPYMNHDTITLLFIKIFTGLETRT